MAKFPTSIDDAGAAINHRADDKKGVLNTHSAFNIPSELVLDTGSVIRFGQGVAAFTIGKAKGSRRFDGADEYDGRAQGEKFQKNWLKEGKTPEQIANDPYSQVEIPEHQKSNWFSGVTVIDSLTMSFPGFTTDSGIEYVGQSINIQNLLMSVSQKKNITRTPIAGAEGRTKQYISMDDYEVEFAGKIIGYDGGDGQGGGFVGGERPEVAIRNFVNFMEAPTTVSIGCDLLEIAKITSGVIADFRLNQEVGKLDNQSFRFKLLSDKPFKIIIEDI